MAKTSPLLAIPPEIVDTILSYLNPYDLTRVSAVCRYLRNFALSDGLWQALIQERVPGVRVTRPYPCANFQELYAAHDPVWFLPQYKLWFCDRDMTGKLIVARFDPRRGCIEGLQVLASKIVTEYSPWEADEGVVIHNFRPSIRLHLDRPVLEFKASYANDPDSIFARLWAKRFSDEVPIDLDERRQGLYSNLIFTKPLDKDLEAEICNEEYPYDSMWPPPVLPAHHRVGGHCYSDEMLFIDTAERPLRRSEVSNQTFRIRRWMEMLGARASLANRAMHGGGGGGAERNMLGAGPTGVHIGEEILTFSTLDPSLYTPTATKPWRGIWIGDYSGHGCEFLLINQPDDEPATDEQLGLFRDPGESDVKWEQRRLDARVFRGRLEAIKLTGDPNVPRGEYTFVVPDLGEGGYLGDATDTRFGGARKVRSLGHVAATGFSRREFQLTIHLKVTLVLMYDTDKFIDSQLLLLSHNRLAQHWTDFGHVSFFERIDLDGLLDPSHVQA